MFPIQNSTLQYILYFLSVLTPAINCTVHFTVQCNSNMGEGGLFIKASNGRMYCRCCVFLLLYSCWCCVCIDAAGCCCCSCWCCVCRCCVLLLLCNCWWCVCRCCVCCCCRCWRRVNKCCMSCCWCCMCCMCCCFSSWNLNTLSANILIW